MVTRAVFNATADRSDPAGRAGEYRWNLTVSCPSDDGGATEYDALVCLRVKRDGATGYSENQRLHGASFFRPFELEDAVPVASGAAVGDER